MIDILDAIKRIMDSRYRATLWAEAGPHCNCIAVLGTIRAARSTSRTFKQQQGD